MPTLCLGEALVDLVCERPAAGLADADAFVPHFGGAAANVAVIAARSGAAVALAGGAGDDAWGRWLRARLESEGVALDWFHLVEGEATAVAFVTIDERGEPDFAIYGQAIAAAMRAAAPLLGDAVEACEALFFSSNTLVAADEREATLAARDRALELGRPVIFDPNLRLHRWPSTAEALFQARACVEGCLLVKCNRVEAELITGEADPARAAEALVAAGARMAAVTLGADGALLRGELPADAPGVPANAVSTLGAGDAFMGVMLARLANSGFYPPAAAAALPEAVAAGARAAERWSAV